MQNLLNKEKTNKGFTLVEMLLVVVLLGITFGVTSDILISIVRSNTKAVIMHGLEQQSNFVSLKIEKELRSAGSVEWDSENTPNQIEISSRDGTRIVTYSIVTNSDGLGVANFTKDSVTYPISDLASPGGVSISCLGNCFEVISYNPTVVKIGLSFEALSSDGGTTTIGNIIVDETIVIRSTY